MAYAESDAEAQAYLAAFREELQKLGWTAKRSLPASKSLGQIPTFSQ